MYTVLNGLKEGRVELLDTNLTSKLEKLRDMETLEFFTDRPGSKTISFDANAWLGPIELRDLEKVFLLAAVALQQLVTVQYFLKHGGSISDAIHLLPNNFKVEMLTAKQDDTKVSEIHLGENTILTKCIKSISEDTEVVILAKDLNKILNSTGVCICDLIGAIHENPAHSGDLDLATGFVFAGSSFDGVPNLKFTTFPDSRFIRVKLNKKSK